MSRGAGGPTGPAWLAWALGSALCLAACAAPAWSSAGETAVARDTAGPTLVILPGSPAPASHTPPAPATLGPALTVSPPTGPAPGEVEPTLLPCASAGCAAQAGHLWLARPIPAGLGYVDYVERSYPYGSTQGGQRVPHHGVEFFNPSGTPVVAAADGEVIVAGDDATAVYGPTPNFYGKLVILEHDQTYAGRPVYTLYGHLRTVDVEVGQRVSAGEALGLVGSTGIAIGAHLHFEVRVGRNDYASTRNPELWLQPLPYAGQPNGVIAGRVLDHDGHVLPEVTVVIRPLSTETDAPRSRFVLTYNADPAINPDDQLQENFAIGDMPRGLYAVSVNTTRFVQQTVTVGAGQVAWVTFVVSPPPIVPTSAATETPAPTAMGDVVVSETAPGEMTATPDGLPAETPTPGP